MSTETITQAMPPVVSREEWQAARERLMTKEKAHTRAKDALSAERRRLPMVKIETDYIFDGEHGERSLLDLFEGRHQLIVQHFMFHPDWENGCPGCTNSVNDIGTVEPLFERDITYAVIARAPIEKLVTYKEKKGWKFPFYSSGRNTFNRDFNVTVEEDNEIPGVSVLMRDGDTIYHTYSTGGRGVELLMGSFGFLDITPYGRKEDWEDSPAGWLQKPTYE